MIPRWGQKLKVKTKNQKTKKQKVRRETQDAGCKMDATCNIQNAKRKRRKPDEWSPQKAPFRNNYR
jgi:hypothetical protein